MGAPRPPRLTFTLRPTARCRFAQFFFAFPVGLRTLRDAAFTVARRTWRGRLAHRRVLHSRATFCAFRYSTAFSSAWRGGLLFMFWRAVIVTAARPALRRSLLRLLFADKRRGQAVGYRCAVCRAGDDTYSAQPRTSAVLCEGGDSRAVTHHNSTYRHRVACYHFASHLSRILRCICRTSGCSLFVSMPPCWRPGW